GYRSDYDLMVVVNDRSFAEEDALWEGVDNRLLEEQIARRIETPVVPIVHTLADVNDQLGRGRPFFVDIARDGIVLYEVPGHPLAKPKPLTPKEQRQEAKGYFEQWFKLSEEALKLAELGMADNIWRHGVFMLHQGTESAYHCALLTLTLYSPKSHRIKVLRSRAEGLDPRLIAAWPRDTRFSRRCFELLSRAYVEARYSSQYEITQEELAWLTERVRSLQEVVKTVCLERLSGE
ncbi:HEPN domain-containing protein, partial [Rhizobium sp. BK661]|uniref:HEPN domain-containing protein n=1 Tax=Rhizobium sp. BK661 TaxID=2586991 RepID=UPI002166E755